MGFWPFAWSWKTKGGGRVWVGGIIITPALVGLNWFLNRDDNQGHRPHQHQHQRQQQDKAWVVGGDGRLERDEDDERRKGKGF